MADRMPLGLLAQAGGGSRVPCLRLWTPAVRDTATSLRARLLREAGGTIEKLYAWLKECEREEGRPVVTHPPGLKATREHLQSPPAQRPR